MKPTQIPHPALLAVLLAASCLLLPQSASANTAPVVSNVVASQRTDGSGIVDIYYRLSDADGDRCTVTIVVSDDGGSTWNVTVTDLDEDSDIGENIPPGYRHIIWQTKTDLPGAYGTNFRVKVIADDGVTTGPIPSSHFMRFPPASSFNTTTFEMGDHFGVGYSDELPVHSVTLNAFYICKYETTNDQYRDYLNAALSANQIIVDGGVVYAASDTSRSQPYFSTREASSYSQISYNIGGSFYTQSHDGIIMSDHPVVMVSWYGANAFCNFYGYRLPTEAEWECAARDGNHYYKYPWATNSIDSSKCNYNMNNPLGFSSYPYTTEVGRYGQYGTYVPCDMAGNVWEWCSDWYSSSYYSSSPGTNPTGPGTGNSRVLRGGSWGSDAFNCRVANRVNSNQIGYGGLHSGNYSIGFRVCLD